MSSHHEKTIGASPGYADMASRMAAIVSDSSSRLLKLQSEAGGAAFAQNAEALHAALNVSGGPAAMSAWPGLCQANVVRVLEVSRRWIEIVSQAQAEMSALLGVRFPAGMGMPLDLAQFTKAMIEGRDAAIGAMQGFLATSVAPANAPGAKHR